MASPQPAMIKLNWSSETALPKEREELALAFVGAIVPDKPEFQTSAFSRAGQTYQSELLQGLMRAGLHVSQIISFVPTPAFPKSKQVWVGAREDEILPGVQSTLLPYLNVSPFKQVMIGLLTVFELLRWGWRTRKLRHRVVYAYNLTVPPGLCVFLGAKLIGARTFVSLCDIDMPGHTVPGTYAWRLNYWMQKKLIPLFDGHVVASDAIASDFLPGRAYFRLDGGITSESLLPTEDLQSRINRADSVFVIAFAGRLDETNGIPTLLEAFALLEDPQFRLWLAGAGTLEHQVWRAASVDPRIEYRGLLSSEGVRKMYAAADILINMRMTQQMNTKYFFPSKLIEYMASGIPAITTCTGHTAQEFADFVYLLREETPQGLAELIRRVANLAPSERRRLGQKAQNYIAINKAWNAQAKKVTQFIRDIVLGPDASPSLAAQLDAAPVLREPQSTLTHVSFPRSAGK